MRGLRFHFITNFFTFLLELRNLINLVEVRIFLDHSHFLNVVLIFVDTKFLFVQFRMMNSYYLSIIINRMSPFLNYPLVVRLSYIIILNGTFS